MLTMLTLLTTNHRFMTSIIRTNSQDMTMLTTNNTSIFRTNSQDLTMLTMPGTNPGNGYQTNSSKLRANSQDIHYSNIQWKFFVVGVGSNVIFLICMPASASIDTKLGREPWHLCRWWLHLILFTTMTTRGSTNVRGEEGKGIWQRPLLKWFHETTKMDVRSLGRKIGTIDVIFGIWVTSSSPLPVTNKTNTINIYYISYKE